MNSRTYRIIEARNAGRLLLVKHRFAEILKAEDFLDTDKTRAQKINRPQFNEAYSKIFMLR